ncbi:MAG: hypothetical protein JRN09_07965 [Nitrososphaerota archaeon]|nr:hypothetical protein [Nitrososphaerota archaeon]
MSVVTEVDEKGDERMRVLDSRQGVLVVEGKVERLTGAGKFVVAPVREDVEVQVGNQVVIVVVDKLMPAVYLQTFKERVTSPFPSNWSIAVKGNRYVERCQVYYAGTQLSALDPAGIAKLELPLPRDGMLHFRIPETVNLDNEAMIEVKDGDTSIDLEKFGSITVLPTKEEYPSVTVSGRFSPPSKSDTYPATIEFTNATTGQRFWAAVANGEYSVQLPNRETYQATVSWNKIPGNRTGTTQAGTLSLNANDHQYGFDANW